MSDSQVEQLENFDVANSDLSLTVFTDIQKHREKARFLITAVCIFYFICISILIFCLLFCERFMIFLQNTPYFVSVFILLLVAPSILVFGYVHSVFKKNDSDTLLNDFPIQKIAEAVADCIKRPE